MFANPCQPPTMVFQLSLSTPIAVLAWGSYSKATNINVQRLRVKSALSADLEHPNPCKAGCWMYPSGTLRNAKDTLVGLAWSWLSGFLAVHLPGLIVRKRTEPSGFPISLFGTSKCGDRFKGNRGHQSIDQLLKGKSRDSCPIHRSFPCAPCAVPWLDRTRNSGPKGAEFLGFRVNIDAKLVNVSPGISRTPG